MSRIKGQFTSLVGLGLFLFIASGNIFGALAIDTETQSIIEQNAGDYSIVAGTELKKDNYLDRMPRELNFTSNNAALALGKGAGIEGNSLMWNDIPSKEQLRENYYLNITERIEETQGDVFGCQSPKVKQPKTENLGKPDNIYNAWYTDIRWNLSDPYIVCSQESVEVNISVGRDSFHVNNTNNRYINLSETAVDVAKEADRIIDETSWPRVQDTESGCDDVREDAIEGAKSSAKTRTDIGSSAFGNVEKPGYQTLTASQMYFEFDIDTDSLEGDDDGCGEDGESPEDRWRAYAQVTDTYTNVNITDSVRTVSGPDGTWDNNIKFGFNYSKSVN
ncbi:MAG: hypothetical protein H8Z69_03040 [Nanohaloarchaea archaeon]|nr:hypothetical protein [Candidatus Nanohaloarchaea archaeon]